ncbi:T9SS type A sorting domain-containing protein [uncultured Algibacter sp.]|uniref:T9SS type A sorting domain-containing protein n=1 Tax=uncultured Algibacter sp. TaxID=298659 RepID=UPI00321692E1
MNLLKLSSLLCFVYAFGFAQINRNISENNFYNAPTSHNLRQVNIVDFGAVRNDNNNDTQALNNAIDDLVATGGGTVFIPSGTFLLNSVILKSNVKVLVSANAVLKPFIIPGQNVTTSTFIMFRAGGNGFINNVALQSDNNNRKFTIDFRGSSYVKSRAISLTNIQNFFISGIRHLDNKSVFPTLNLSISGPLDNLKSPRFGVIKNMTTTNTVSGYGLIQMQAANNILFKNLACTGGIALRLESDFRRNAFRPEAQQQKINQIIGRNIRCTNGQAAVQISPHTIDQGIVDIRNIRSTSCEYALKVEGGFTTDDEESEGLTPGSFNSNSFFSNINATWGANAQVRPVFLRFIPCNLRDRIRNNNSANESSNIAPSLAPVLMFERGSPERVVGFYGVKIRSITKNGFQSQVPNIIRDFCADDYICNSTTTNSGIRIFEPPICRRASSAKQIDLVKKVSMSPNPASTNINITALGNSHIDIYNINNQSVISEDLTGKNSKQFYNSKIQVSQLKSGIYFVKINNASKTTFKKLIIK